MKDNCIPDIPITVVDVLKQQGGSIGSEPSVPPMLHGIKDKYMHAKHNDGTQNYRPEEDKNLSG